MINVASFLIVIAICIISHEYGHYIAAVWRNVLVYEFSFGMGPRLLSWKKGETLWSISAFPIGGYVKLDGEDADPDDNAVKPENYDSSRALNNKKPWERFIIIAAGAFLNLALAWILTAAYLTGYGTYDMDTPKIGNVMQGKPAYVAGLKKGDVVDSINGVKLNKWADIRKTISSAKSNDNFKILVKRGGENLSFDIKIGYDNEYKGRLLGVQPSMVRYPISRALARSFSYSWEMGVEILKGMWMALTGQVKAEVVGPVGIASFAGDAFRRGFWTFIAFLGVINLHLGLLNLLPLPALDGGRLVFIVYEMFSGKKLLERYESKIHYVGLLVLISLMALITARDIFKLFN
ncbi:MAG: RIP metalloprotease RseP [Synergistaceae bacterium]|nr:RIP metalloprotease RseP [Synergistaceae bacterium]